MLETQSLAGRTALITGSASGIGKAVAERFQRQGARLVLADCSPQVAEIAAELQATGGEVIGINLEVTDPASVASAIDQGR